MYIEVDRQYNIKSIIKAGKDNTNPIFRGIVKKMNHNNTCDIEVTEYNLTRRYQPGDIIRRINVDRIGLPVHVNSNSEALAFLKKKEE